MKYLCTCMCIQFISNAYRVRRLYWARHMFRWCGDRDTRPVNKGQLNNDKTLYKFKISTSGGSLSHYLQCFITLHTNCSVLFCSLDFQFQLISTTRVTRTNSWILNMKSFIHKLCFSVCDCKRDCENLSGCNFWTFDEADEICTLMSNCDGGTGDACLTCSWWGVWTLKCTADESITETCVPGARRSAQRRATTTLTFSTCFNK